MVSIRTATTSDADPLFELVRAFPTPTPATAEQFSAALDSKLPDPASCVLVAEDDGRLVGYVAGYWHATFYAGGPTAWVDELLVIEPCAVEESGDNSWTRSRHGRRPAAAC